MKFILMAISESAASLKSNDKHADISGRVYTSIDDALKYIPAFANIATGGAKAERRDGDDLELLEDPELLDMYQVATYVEDFAGREMKLVSFYIVRVA
jgi:hypothetical protein